MENHVRYLETHLVEKLKEQRYTSFEAINAETRENVLVTRRTLLCYTYSIILLGKKISVFHFNQFGNNHEMMKNMFTWLC